MFVNKLPEFWHTYMKGVAAFLVQSGLEKVRERKNRQRCGQEKTNTKKMSISLRISILISFPVISVILANDRFRLSRSINTVF